MRRVASQGPDGEASVSALPTVVLTPEKVTASWWDGRLTVTSSRPEA